MHKGDYDAAAVIYGKFTTYRPSTGQSYTLAGTPALSVYKDNSTTQSTSGVTLTADFDSVVGLNHYAIDTSTDGTFYAAGSFFDVVITTGTVDGISVVGSVVASFTIRKNSALKPAIAGRTLDVTAGSALGSIAADAISAAALATDAVAEIAAAVIVDVPTATENADALLNRDMAAVSDTNSRSPLQALRFVRNGFSISGATLTVLKEDDSTAAYTRDLTTNPAAEPITGVS